MKKFLHKKWLSIPVIVVLVLALTAGSVFAYFEVWSQSSAEIEVLESIEVLDANDMDPSWPSYGAQPPKLEALRFLPSTIYPGQGSCETYLIHNMGPIPIEVTVTQTEPAGTEFAGLALEWANSTADMLIDENAVPLDKICLNTEEDQILSFTFIIGTYEYDGLAMSGGERHTPEKGDSAYVKVFAGFKVLDGVDPITDINFTVSIGRGK